MLPRSGTTTTAQRKGGPRSRSHNDDRFKGTNTGVPIPEVQRGSDGIEDFENLLETTYEPNRLSQHPRNTRQKTPNGVAKSANYQSERAPDEFLERPVPRSKPSSAMGPRSLRTTEADYVPLPSPRSTINRLDQPTNLLSSALRARSPPYDPTSLQYSASRSSQGFGALSRYQDEQVDPETVMEAYIDYDGGLNADQDSPSPPPAVHSSPPQVSRKSLLPSPSLTRSRKSVAPQTEEENAANDNRTSSPSISRHAKGKQRAAEERENPVIPSSKVNGKSRSEAIDDEPTREEDTPLNSPNKSLEARLSGNGDQFRLPDDEVEPRSGDEGEPPNEVEVEVPRDDYDYGEQIDDGGGAPADPAEEEGQEEPPASRSEHSDAESEEAPPPKGKKKGKEKGSDEKKKKRSREDDDDPPRQKKKPKSTAAKPPSRAKSKTPGPDEDSWIEPLVSPSEDEEDDEGIRRSRRARMAPVKFWLGEKLEYDTWKPGSNRQVPTIIGVRRVPEQTVSLVRRKRRPQQKGRSKSRRLDSEEAISRGQSVVPVEDGWDAETESTGVVLDWDTKEEIEKLIVYTANQVEPQWTDKREFRYQRLFTEEKFVAAGEVIIPPHGTKPKKSAKDNTYIFYLIEGAIHVIVHEAKFYLASGGMFLVPRGNSYYIRNMRDYPAKLFFVQGRMMTEEDLETVSAHGTNRESMVPFSKSRHVMEDYAAHRRSASRSGFDSSSPHKSRGGSRPIAPVPNANGRRR
ncbi:hypothetical protein FRB91_004576 [Serendipita sp. 411]|nr:hypothetical protein FRB91_004576 [Serendipita sp. 411]